MRVSPRGLSAVVVLGVLAGCGSSTTGPAPPSVGAPSVSCPAGVNVTAAPGSGEVVTYPAPVETGGTPPLTTTCSPASGATFQVGTTPVTCTATDAIKRPASCSFVVSVTAAHLGAMRFVAFGDSLTAGENGTVAGLPTSASPNCGPVVTSARRKMAQARPSDIDVPNAYPTQLLAMMQARFPSQTLTMSNEGLPRETAEDGVGRLTSCVFMTDHPDVLLLLEGVNDIAGDDTWQTTEMDEQTIFDDLATDVQNALSSGVSFVFVSTILPVRACDPEPIFCQFPDPSVVPTANASISRVNARILAGIQGATIVDGNKAYWTADSTLVSLVGPDGLHGLPLGYGVLAKAFLAAIVSHVPVTAVRGIHR
jgi:lysophospholipase L1-like esterase